MAEYQAIEVPTPEGGVGFSAVTWFMLPATPSPSAPERPTTGQLWPR